VPPALTRLERLEDLDALLARTAARPLVLYKHSLTCGTSAYALDALSDYLGTAPADADYAMVAVQPHRDVSNEIARRLGVRHETPQVILVRDGRAVWNASHFRVTADAVERAVAAHLAEAPPRAP
jgi:bacillithiol system protein YtxJ